VSLSGEAISDFIDYIISDDEGWIGLRDDAPEKTKQAYAEYLEEERQAEAESSIR